MLNKLYKNIIFFTLSILVIMCLISCTNKQIDNSQKKEVIENKTKESEIDEVLVKLDDKKTDEEKYISELKNDILNGIEEENISPTTLNLAYRFSYDDSLKLIADKKKNNNRIKRPTFSNADRINSKAGVIYSSLIDTNVNFLNDAYKKANDRKYNNVILEYKDSDNNKMFKYYTIKQIMAMANVYNYYHNTFSEKDFLNYCSNLLLKSLRYEENISDIYYCSGCKNADGSLYKNVEKETFYLSPKELTSRIIATDSIIHFNLKNEKFNSKKKNMDDFINTQLAGKLDRMFYTNEEISRLEENHKFDLCEGHQDLLINIYLTDLDDELNLYDIDLIGNDEANFNDNWHGWDIYKKEEVEKLLNKNWEELYAIKDEKIYTRDILKIEEMNHYLNMLPKDISKERYNIIKVALESVGRIPYRWGGIAYNPEFIKNSFYTEVRPDENGRKFRGLDCAGWVNWVIWAATGVNTKLQGTVRLQNYGKRIRRSALEPGDIVVRPYVDSHVVMFLGWAEDGKMYAIHENATHNNVSVDKMDFYYTYYQKIPFK